MLIFRLLGVELLLFALRQIQAYFMLNTEEQMILQETLDELMQDRGFISMETYIQHGRTSCLWHSIAVAYYSCLLLHILPIGNSINQRSMIRGALLHDYFLYDWHDRQQAPKMHGIAHPERALTNAQKNWQLDRIECDVIIKHMFPLTPIPPKYKEAAVVSLADKLCSLYETVHRWENPYQARLESCCAGQLIELRQGNSRG